MKKSYKAFDEYINDQSQPVRELLLELSNCILEVVPNAKKMINYNIPAFALIEDGKAEQQIMIAAFKNHIGFYPHPTTMAHFWEQLDDFKKAKGSVQFPLTKALPKELIIKMVKYREALIKINYENKCRN